jgi:hypothetical protein
VRAGRVPRWTLVAVALAVVMNLIAPETPVLELVKNLLGVSAFAWLGLRVLTMSEAEWEGVEQRPAVRPELAPTPV